MTNSEADGAKRLLVVDDDEAIQALMEAVFRRQAVMVEHASDGGIALELLRKEPFDVVVLDLMLPEVNGFELIRELKHRDPELLRRTIVLTAATDSTLLHFDDARHVRRIIRKPFELTDFIHEVLCCAGIVSSLPVLSFEHHAH